MEAGAERVTSGIRWARYYFAGIVVLLIGTGAWLAYRAVQIEHHLLRARATVDAIIPTVKSEAAGGPIVNLEAQTRQVTGEAAAAHSAAHDPLWLLAGHIPWLGRPLRQATALADAADQLSRVTVPDVTRAASDLAPLRASRPGQAIDLAAVQRAATPLRAAVTALDDSLRTVDGSPPKSYIGRLNQVRASLLAQMESLHKSLGPVASTSELVPPMLGAGGPRAYLVMFENPAEARGTGGVVAGHALVTAAGGHVRVTEIGSNDLNNLAAPASGVQTPFEREFPEYGVGQAWLTTNMSPDFVSAGRLWTAMYDQEYNAHIGGVLAVDPVGLAAMLQGTAPVTVDMAGRHFALDSSNVVSFLERDEYTLNLDEPDRKALLVDVGHQVLDQLLNTQAHASDLLKQLATAAAGGHIQLYSAAATEESTLAQWPVGGALPDNRRSFAELVVNNATGTKLDYYLQTSLHYETACPASGQATITATLTNTAPTAGLPAFVTNGNSAPLGDQAVGADRDIVSIYAGSGARLLSASYDGSPIGTDPHSVSSGVGVYLTFGGEEGHPFWTTGLDLAPGQKAVITLKLAIPASDEEPPILAAQALPDETSRTLHVGCG